MAHDPLLEQYLAVADRIMALTGNVDMNLSTAPVPATPGWTVQQVVAHLAGLCEDWTKNNLDRYGSDDWTEHQVQRFADQPIAQIIEKWRIDLIQFAALTESPLGQTPGRWAFGDALTHEADIRGVVAPGTRPPDDAIALGLKAAVSRWRQRLAETDAPALRIIEPGREWIVGARAADDEMPTVTTDRFELMRALFGRRSRKQVESWNWSHPPEPWLAAGLSYPFSWADVDLAD